MSDTDQFSDQKIIALTAWGEARGLGQQGMQATICTGQNRLASGIRWWGTNLREIFLHPYQYSCWLTSDPNRSKLLSIDETDPQYVIAINLAAAAMGGNLNDNVSGADSYYASTLPEPPKWADGLTACVEIGDQLYFRTV